MSKPPPARYRTTNWSSYNASLRKRGSLLIWIDKDMTWRASRDGRPGRPPVFSDAAIQFCLSIKVLFRLPLRQTAGMMANLLRLAGLDWPVPDFSTLCRRQKTLAVQIPYRRADGPLNLLVDSTGIKFLGDGDSPVLPDLLGQDEPTSGVASNEKFAFMDVVMHALTDDDVAVLFIEHDMDIVRRYARRVIVFHEGRILADDVPDDALNQDEVKRYVTGALE